MKCRAVGQDFIRSGQVENVSYDSFRCAHPQDHETTDDQTKDDEVL
jgi:hypothetical protein